VILRHRKSRADGRPHRPRPVSTGRLSTLDGSLRRLLSRRRRIRPTREGWVFLAAALAVALAALNTGNNLLYLVFATQLAMITLSGVLSELSIQQLRLRRRLSSRLFANVSTRGRWSVSNPRRKLPSLAISVREVSGRNAELTEGGLAQLPLLGAMESRELEAKWVFGARGVHRLSGVRVATTWPFGIFEKYYDIPAPQEVLVHPAPLAVIDGKVTLRGTNEEGRATQRRGDGTFLGLREHKEGDDPRRVHWPSSARRGHLVAVERADHRGGELAIIVRWPSAKNTQDRVLEFEQELSRATTLVLAAERAQRAVRLLMPDGVVIETQGPSYAVVLSALALAELPGRGIGE